MVIQLLLLMILMLITGLAEKQPWNTNEGGRGNWRVFTGNEIGSMLGWWAMENFNKNYKNFDGSKVHLICSTVSSKLLRSIAKVEGIQFSETLTGFKWMGNLSHTLLEKGEEVLFAFEEAIGFMFGTAVLDEDGVSAAAVTGEMAAYFYSNGQAFSLLLENIYLKYGQVVSSNSYFICHSKEMIKD
ncbi:PREDICTED: phosphoglucomutase-2-like [Amphimedon queenslandica]|uniref:Alpha-D-phosphohexomutase alpha/beta/alpha domain-containing protein n=1 Tax=Amphimedon queenslandica TaxID=400682 RepID=A0AAN0JPQ2_AMPQE|nr:PREDICTED: phosphoglucomutase-2-like [Amphimedon queenslandica]|eukprot:XP_019859006.1 PREDICTED: phosphoglucomutase-2-like [Amphimedon queenslandica]